MVGVVEKKSLFGRDAPQLRFLWLFHFFGHHVGLVWELVE
jgi:hypothetical protein